MPLRDPAAWMWAEACQMLDRADRLHRQFFHVRAPRAHRAVWEPPVDVFENQREIVLVVALPGVSPERVEIGVDGNVLVIRAEREMPMGNAAGRVQRLEIPNGQFERRIVLPDIVLEAGAPRFENGCLILNLRKRSVA